MDELERLSQVLGERYQVERELGRGGMAIVYLARDRKLGRPVAIKVMRPELSNALGADRFLREIEITARLSHPRIVTVHDSGATDDVLYFVMQFVQGESLRARLEREGQLPIDDAVRIAGCVAAALAHAHTQGVIHRDIKPENILLAEGETFVADFGIGRAVAGREDDRLTQTGISLGSPAYMSPEQTVGDGTVDGRADIFSLGCVLYEMLVGEAPFRGPTMQATVARLMLEPMPSIRSVRPAVSVALENVVRKALEKAPADRFATASAFSEALNKAIVEPTGTASVAPAVASPARRRIAIAAVGMLAIAGIGGTAYSMFHRPSGDGIAVLGFDNHGSNHEDDYIGAGLADELTNILVKLPKTKVFSLRSLSPGVAVSDSAGRASGAKTLLRGDFQHVGKGVRVTVALVNAANGEIVSTERYSQDSLDMFALRDTVAQAVVGKLRLALDATTSADWKKRSTKNPQALEAYSQGRLLFRTRRGPKDLLRALEYFRTAIALDSSYAQAWSGMSDAVGVVSAFGVFAPRDSFPKAKEYALRALKLDPLLAEAHTSLALIELIYENDVVRGLAEVDTALTLNPYYAEAHLFRAWSLLYGGHPADAVVEASRARELDPFSVVANARYGWMMVAAHRYAEAEHAIQFALDLDPTSGMAWTELGYVYVAQKNCAKALHAADMIDDAFPLSESGIKGYIYAKCGQPEKARQYIATVEAASAHQFVLGSRIALAFLGLGQTDSAHVWLDRAVEQRLPLSPSTTTPDPYLELFLPDPRAQSAMARRSIIARGAQP